MPTSSNDAIAGFLATQQSAQTDFLRELVRIPSDNPPGDCAPHSAVLARLLTEHGLDVHPLPVAPALAHANGMLSATNLIVRRTFGQGGPVVALNAHGDVVPPGLGWKRDPYGAQIEQDPEHGPVMYGRGAAVSKSDFATYTWALLALEHLEREGVRLNGTVELHFTYDEEAGGEIGPGLLLKEGASRPDYAISAGFSYGIVSSHNGCLHMEVSVRGRQAHAAMPDSGVDALEAATHVMRALYDYREQLALRHSAVPGIQSPTLNIGLIKGGINTNVVPDDVTFRVDRRMIPEEAGTDIEAELLTVIEQAGAGRPDVQIQARRIMLAQPLVELPGARVLIDTIRQRAAEVFATDIPVQGSPLYTDARHYTQHGIPTILYGAGPRTLQEAGGHNADENIRLKDLFGATRVMALALADLLQGTGA